MGLEECRQKAKLVVTHFDESVDGENDKFWLSLGVIHQVQVDELFLLQAAKMGRYGQSDVPDPIELGHALVSLHVLEHIREQSCADNK